jgi:aspartate kinase
LNNIEVLKIGGGILQNKDCFDRVINIVKNKKEENKDLILVLSALYGVTDFLINSIDHSFNDSEKIESIITELKNKHYHYLEFIQNQQVKEQAKFEIDDKISILEKFFYGISYLKEISPRSKDMIQSFGERLSPIVLEAFLKDNNIDARFIDAEEAGIICTGNFEKANADMEKTTINLQKIKPELTNKVILLPGYYGIDENKDVKTFGRGGTDYSAGFISNIYNAKLEIWKDVSGFMSADPKLVENAIQINNLSYEEAEELGYLGAKILHPRTMNPLREKNLQAEIKDLFNPQKKGTIIGNLDESKANLKSITSTDISIINIHSAAMVDSAGFAGKLFSVLKNENIPVDLISTSETAISFSVVPKDTQKTLNALEIFKNCKIKSFTDLSIIGIVGEGIKDTIGLGGKLFTAVAEENVNIELVAQGASEINISFVIKKESKDKVIKAIHKKLIEKQIN